MTFFVLESWIYWEGFILDINITGRFNSMIDEAIWFLSDASPTDEEMSLLEVSYIKTTQMLLSDNPLVFRFVSGDCGGRLGQIVPNVFFCDPDKFEVKNHLCVNTSFWKECVPCDGFVNELNSIGGMLFGNNGGLTSNFIRWSKELGLHCLDIYHA